RFDLTEEQLPTVAVVLRKRISLLSEVEERLESFLGPLSPERSAARAAMFDERAADGVLRAIRERLEALPAWEESGIDAAIREGGKAAGARGKTLFMPLRLALTGEEHGPELARVAYLLGRERVLERLGGK
ncbi:MAG TPA: hypothetical protein VFZ18_14455, partial [Longimicrobiaceae bacterium]